MIGQATTQTRVGLTARIRDARVPLEQRLKRLLDDGPQAIEERLAQLDREWSAGRVTKLTLAVIIGGGLALTFWVSPFWAVLPALAAVSLLQALFTRDSLLAELFGRVGFRPGCDIEQEKLALRALRGDFKRLPTMHDVEDRDAIARLEGEGGIAPEHDEPKSDVYEAVREVVGATRL